LPHQSTIGCLYGWLGPIIKEIGSYLTVKTRQRCGGPKDKDEGENDNEGERVGWPDIQFMIMV
jgi:hypothetical protein